MCESCKITCQCLGFQYFLSVDVGLTQVQVTIGQCPAGEASLPRGTATPAISSGLEGCEGTPGWFWLQLKKQTRCFPFLHVRGVPLAIKYKVEAQILHLELLGFETLQLPCPGPGVLGPQSSFSQNQQNGKLKRKGKEDPVRAGERRKQATFKSAQDRVVFWCTNVHNFFFTYKKNAIIINPNKDDTQFAATFSKRFGKRVFTSRQPRLTPGKQPPEFPNCVPFSLKETRGYDPWSTTC